MTIKGEIPYIGGIHSRVITICAHVNKSKFCRNLTFTMKTMTYIIFLINQSETSSDDVINDKYFIIYFHPVV